MMSKYEEVPVPEGSVISTDSQHETLQAHIAQCEQCQEAIKHTGKDMRVFAKTGMCNDYMMLVRAFAMQ